jgi:hypothetical protein
MERGIPGVDPALYNSQQFAIGPLGSFGDPSALTNIGSGTYGTDWGGDGA